MFGRTDIVSPNFYFYKTFLIAFFPLPFSSLIPPFPPCPHNHHIVVFDNEHNGLETLNDTFKVTTWERQVRVQSNALCLFITTGFSLFSPLCQGRPLMNQIHTTHTPFYNFNLNNAMLFIMSTALNTNSPEWSYKTENWGTPSLNCRFDHGCSYNSYFITFKVPSYIFSSKSYQSLREVRTTFSYTTELGFHRITSALLWFLFWECYNSCKYLLVKMHKSSWR